ncbi:MAG: hypothetical protein K8L99_13450 [Anaerolineae bacterium]|nr:hypothetical protein [Anaerolineae bacterium]
MPPKKSFFGFNVTHEEREKIHQLAQKRGFKITSDYLRHLLIQDAEAQGETLIFELDRGGDRR